MKQLKPILVVLLSLQILNTKAQHEFLAKVDPATGVHTRIDSIPGVYGINQNGSTYDKNHHRYIFLGIDFGNQRRLYCVNALNGSLISSPSYTINIGELHYDNSSDKLYGLQINNTTNKMFLVSLNPGNAASTLIDTLPFTGYAIGTSFFNENTHNFVIQNSSSLYSMNTITGNISSVPVSATFGSVCFDNVHSYAYGLIMGNSMTLAKINLSNGTHSIVCTFTLNGTTSTHKAFDEINQRYSFGSSGHLYSIAVNSGSIVLSPSFPVGLTRQENVVELNYDNSDGTLYALHWGNVTATGISNQTAITKDEFSIAPNPATKSTLINMGREVGEINFRVINALGQVILSGTEYQAETITLKLDRLSRGVYFVTVTDEKKFWGTRKLVVE